VADGGVELQFLPNKYDVHTQRVEYVCNVMAIASGGHYNLALTTMVEWWHGATARTSSRLCQRLEQRGGHFDGNVW